MSIEQQINDIQQKIYGLEAEKKALMLSATLIWYVSGGEIVSAHAIKYDKQELGDDLYLDERNYYRTLGKECWLTQEEAVAHQLKVLEDFLLSRQRLVKKSEQELEEFKKKYGLA